MYISTCVFQAGTLVYTRLVYMLCRNTEALQAWVETAVIIESVSNTDSIRMQLPHLPVHHRALSRWWLQGVRMYGEQLSGYTCCAIPIIYGTILDIYCGVCF